MRNLRVVPPLLLLAAGALLPVGATAVDPTLCADDGVSEVPPFAQGRDADGCLLVDPGNGEPVVRFQYEVFHADGSAAVGDPEFAVDTTADAYGRCRTKPDVPCTFVIWDSTFDNYYTPKAANRDIWEVGGTFGQHWLIKDTRWRNGYKCDGGGWKGPNGIECIAGEPSASHSDGWQLKNDVVVGDGWFVVQDSELVNGHINLWLNQNIPASGRSNWVIQGLRFGQYQQVGEAASWIDECLARGGSLTTCRRVDGNRLQWGAPTDVWWVVDVYGGARFKNFPREIVKIVQVNTGCGTEGCGGPVEFHNGWAHPFHVGTPGPGVCPEGLVTLDGLATDPSGNPTPEAMFCYTSIEEALADTVTPTSAVGDCPAPYCPHAQPPFLQLSTTGWEGPPP